MFVSNIRTNASSAGKLLGKTQFVLSTSCNCLKNCLRVFHPIIEVSEQNKTNSQQKQMKVFFTFQSIIVGKLLLLVNNYLQFI